MTDINLEVIKYGPLWRRSLAGIIDILLCIVIFALLIMPIEIDDVLINLIVKSLLLHLNI